MEWRWPCPRGGAAHWLGSSWQRKPHHLVQTSMEALCSPPSSFLFAYAIYIRCCCIVAKHANPDPSDTHIVPFLSVILYARCLIQAEAAEAEEESALSSFFPSLGFPSRTIANKVVSIYVTMTSFATNCFSYAKFSSRTRSKRPPLLQFLTKSRDPHLITYLGWVRLVQRPQLGRAQGL